jgi:hypothetical protein
VSLFPPGEVVRLSGEIARSVAGVGRVAVRGARVVMGARP